MTEREMERKQALHLEPISQFHVCALSQNPSNPHFLASNPRGNLAIHL